MISAIAGKGIGAFAKLFTFILMKVFLDVLLAVLALIILSPLLVLVALIVFVADFHSPLFLQDRLGQNKRVFQVIKFRSMLNGEVSFVGRLLRKTGIDELPQLLNILMLQMSFVGPRPLTLDDVNRLQWTDDYYNERWKMKPGIAGLAQLSPVCNKKMSWFLDKHYILHQNFALDFQIILSSALIPFVGKQKVIKWLHKR